jgi:hypothetical protein
MFFIMTATNLTQRRKDAKAQGQKEDWFPDLTIAIGWLELTPTTPPLRPGVFAR